MSAGLVVVKLGYQTLCRILNFNPKDSPVLQTPVEVSPINYIYAIEKPYLLLRVGVIFENPFLPKSLPIIDQDLNCFALWGRRVVFPPTSYPLEENSGMFIRIALPRFINSTLKVNW